MHIYNLQLSLFSQLGLEEMIKSMGGGGGGYGRFLYITS